jgi:hypothetical protein
VRSSDLLIEELLLGLSISDFTTPNVWWYLGCGWRLLNRARTWARLKIGASPLPGVDRSSVLRAITGAFSHAAAIAHLRDSEVLLWRVVRVALSLHGVRCGWRLRCGWLRPRRQFVATTVEGAMHVDCG